MSDILIKNMKMPENCSQCNFCQGFECLALKRTFNLISKDDCPLVEVPTHGRLIDADALAERIEEQRNTEYAMKNKPHGSWRRILELSLDMISDAPTIIEAEGT